MAHHQFEKTMQQVRMGRDASCIISQTGDGLVRHEVLETLVIHGCVQQKQDTFAIHVLDTGNIARGMEYGNCQWVDKDISGINRTLLIWHVLKWYIKVGSGLTHIKILRCACVIVGDPSI